MTFKGKSVNEVTTFLWVSSGGASFEFHAAGLSIADSLGAGRRVYSQGVRNLNDGISALAIADSTVENLSQIVTRIRELAEQAANGSFTSTQRLGI